MNQASRLSRTTDQRLQRLMLWLALTVARFIAPMLNAVAPRAAKRALSDYARAARLLITLAAVRRVAFKAPKRGDMPIGARRHTTRRVAGAALRRALRKDPRALCAALAASERWIATIMRRLRRGLTKLCCLPKPRRVVLATLARAPLGFALAADTS